ATALVITIAATMMPIALFMFILWITLISFPSADNKPVENPAHDADEQRTKHCGEKSIDAETGDQPRGQPEAERVEDEDKEAECEERQWQRQKEEDRPDDCIDESEDHAGDERRQRTGDVDPGQQPCRDDDREAVEHETSEESHPWLFLNSHGTRAIILAT